MIFRPLVANDLSGSIAGITASHNRGGPYFRSRAIPVNPNTPFQQVVRSNMSNLAFLWIDTLTAAQRELWDTYALNVPLPNAIGEPRNVGGLGMYQRSNTPRLQAGLTRIDDAPLAFSLAGYTPPTIDSITGATGLLSLAFETTDGWANQDDAAMFVYTARPQNQSINFFKGPYRLAGIIEGDGVTPPTSPASITMAFGVPAGFRGFIRVNVTRADGRLGSDFRDFQLSV